MRASWLLLDNLGSPITNGEASTSVKVRRLTDGFLYDWNDNTFKNSGWVAVSVEMDEIDAVNLPGWYEALISEASWDDGLYQLITSFDDGVVKRFGSSQAEIKDGLEIILSDLSDVSVEDVIRAFWTRAVVNKETGVFTVYKLDKLTPLVTGTVDVTETQSERIPD